MQTFVQPQLGRPSLQDVFLDFERRIRLDVEGYGRLRKKRDLILERLEYGLPCKFISFNQGSFELHTGVWPAGKGEVDIDVGIILDVDPEKIGAVQAKNWVLEAVRVQAKKPAELRRNCVTVWYAAYDDMPAFHVDIAVYAPGDDGLVIAVGKEDLGRRPFWTAAQPKELIAAVRDRFHSEERDQFRRVVRYLKRWRDVEWSEIPVTAPSGLALTMLAFHHFRWAPGDDAGALLLLVRQLLQSSGASNRLVAPVPVASENDTLAKLGAAEMAIFMNKLGNLHGQLEHLRAGGGRPGWMSGIG